ncbi:MBL fold metallo-hydrolase [Pseudoalteromonas pernae]|uniref:MBL fold metallo-hydrolase n=1 Tax=Pseudoalteromonas pernae TaxID=3118054 RepID=UPI003241D405
MRVQVLGSSSGTPTTQRNVSAYAVFKDDLKPWYLVDCGEGTQHQILKSTLAIYHLEAIFITHKHGDHCYGLPGLIASAGLSGRTHPMYLIAPDEVLSFVRSVLEMTELTLAFELKLLSVEQCAGQSFSWVDVTTCPLKHRVPSYAYKFVETQIVRKLNINKLTEHGIPSGPHFNLLQRGENTSFNGQILLSDDYTFNAWRARVIIVCGDNEAPKCLDDEIEGTDLLVHEATFLAVDLKKVGFHTGHSDVERVAKYAQKRELPSLLLTHFSARYGGELCMNRIKETAQARYSGALYIAADGMTIEVDKQGVSHLIEAQFSG